jgi:hypothetical protein
MLTSSTAADPLTGTAAWSSGTTYANGDLAYGTDGIIYQSILSSNLGNQPSVSPIYWEQVGYLEPAYAGGTTYALNDTVSYLHRIYQSLQASNTGNTPLTSPAWWEDVGAVNRWRCFDVFRNTATVAASPLTIVVTPGKRIDSAALLGLVADSVRIRMTSVAGGGTVYDETIDLRTRYVDDWYTYFFNEFTFKLSTVVFDLPPYSDGIITIDITRATGKVSCGSLVIGSFADLGKTQYSAESDALNFSTIERDDFGNTTLIARRTVPKTTQQIWTNKGNTNRLVAVRTTLNAVPAVWSGLDDNDQDYFEALLILGVYKQFTINLAYQDYAVSTIELEEI